MKIGILCAIPEELRHFSRQEQPDTTIGGRDFYRGTHAKHELVLVECGIGKVNAALASTLLLHEFQCELLIFSGVAGGLDSELQIGDLVIADELLQHDFGTIVEREMIAHRAGSFPVGRPKENRPFRLRGDLRARIEAAHPKARFGRILTGDVFLNCKETRQELFTKFEAQAIEMEGGAVAQVAEQFGKPCLIVRSLSDLAGEESIDDFPAFLKQAAEKSCRVVDTILDAL